MCRDLMILALPRVTIAWVVAGGDIFCVAESGEEWIGEVSGGCSGGGW